MKIMISQPMSGKTNEEILKEREHLVKRLEKEGHVIIDTVFKEKAPENVDRAIYFLGKSIMSMSEADIVVFMKGWENARGCLIEYEIANRYGKYVKEVNE